MAFWFSFAKLLSPIWTCHQVSFLWLTLMAEWYQQWHSYCHIWNCCDWKSPSSKCAKIFALWQHATI